MEDCGGTNGEIEKLGYLSVSVFELHFYGATPRILIGFGEIR